ncbi:MULTISPECIES: hypothetical protein [Enterococcus]|nr:MULTISPECIES: hypothetical protein [Enterococcus]
MAKKEVAHFIVYGREKIVALFESVLYFTKDRATCFCTRANFCVSASN